MATDTNSNPEDEYADDEYADHDAEDREQPWTSTEIPDDEPEADVLEQHQEVLHNDGGAGPSRLTEIPDDEPEADVLEQHQEVRYGDDDNEDY